MKKLFITVIIICSSQISFSQDIGYIGISFGPNISLGDYGGTSINDESGYAKNGYLFDVSFGYKLGEGNIGIAGLFRSFANQVDVEALADDLNKDIPTGWIGTIETTGWSNLNFSIGGYGSWPISDIISFDARALIGFLSSSSPELKMELIDLQSGTMVIVEQTSSKAGSFSFVIGGGLKFDVGNKVALLINLDYLTANPEFEFESIDPITGNTIIDKFDQPIRTFNFGFGVAYRL